MTLEDMDREDKLLHLLESPAPIVVKRLVDELRRHIELIDELKSMKRRTLDEDDVDTLLAKYNFT